MKSAFKAEPIPSMSEERRTELRLRFLRKFTENAAQGNMPLAITFLSLLIDPAKNNDETMEKLRPALEALSKRPPLVEFLRRAAKELVQKGDQQTARDALELMGLNL